MNRRRRVATPGVISDLDDDGRSAEFPAMVKQAARLAEDRRSRSAGLGSGLHVAVATWQFRTDKKADEICAELRDILARDLPDLRTRFTDGAGGAMVAWPGVAEIPVETVPAGSEQDILVDGAASAVSALDGVPGLVRLAPIGPGRFGIALLLDHITVDGPARDLVVERLSAALRGGLVEPPGPAVSRYALTERARYVTGGGDLVGRRAGLLAELPADLGLGLADGTAWRHCQDRSARLDAGRLDRGAEAIAGPLVDSLAALALTVASLGGSRAGVVLTPLENRLFPGAEHTVGWLSNRVPLGYDLTAVATVDDLLMQAADSVTDAMLHQSVPFELLWDQGAAGDAATGLFPRFTALNVTDLTRGGPGRQAVASWSPPRPAPRPRAALVVRAAWSRDTVGIQTAADPHQLSDLRQRLATAFFGRALRMIWYGDRDTPIDAAVRKVADQ